MEWLRVGEAIMADTFTDADVGIGAAPTPGPESAAPGTAATAGTPAPP